MRNLLLIFFCLYVQAGFGQNLSGFWRGTRTQNSGGCFTEYSLEFQITYADQQILGRSYSFLNKQQFTKILFSGKYNPNAKRMVIIESGVLQYSVPEHCIPCIKTYDLIWSQQNGIEQLKGEWKGHEMGNNSICPPGKILLTRQKESVFPVEIDQSPQLAALQNSQPAKDRKKILVEELKLDTSQLLIELFDNAEIDDDTVSVYLNNKLLLHRKRLTQQALQLAITAFPNTDYELMMYAENLGKIPPNTALMIIRCGSKRYELRMVSSEENSAVVRFRYEQ